MNQACVSLEEVFAAAGTRAASLVPETSGYLTLAVADATSRLPYQHDDRAVLLTVDGNVIVPRKTTIVPPRDAALGLRDVLRRLLATSTGSMPGLAAAARSKGDEHGVDHVVADIEAALIPVNRAAAKRALARLARETLRAKEMGKLRKKPPPAPAPAKPAAAVPAPVAAAVPAPLPAPAPAPLPAPAPVVAPAPVIEIAPPPLVTILHEVHHEAPPAPVIAPLFTIELPAAPADFPERPETQLEYTDPDATIADPEAMAVFEAHDETATAAGTLVAERDDLPADFAGDPDDADDALTRPWQPDVAPVAPIGTVALAVAPVTSSTPEAASPPAPPAPARIEIVRMETPTAAVPQAGMFSEPAGTRADELLEAFHAQDHSDAVLAAARGLRELTGVDGTPPPRPAPRGPARSTPPLSARPAPRPLDERDDDDDLDLPPPRPRSQARSRWPLAIFALGVLVLFAAWLYRPTLAQGVFGLRERLLQRSAPAAPAEVATAPSAAPPPVTIAPPAPAAPARLREARAGDAAQRRRD